MSLFEMYLKFKGYDLLSASKKLEKIKLFDLDEFIVWQDKKKWEIAKFHYNNNSFYKNKVGKIFPDQWSDLPIITKSDLQTDMNLISSNLFSKKNLYFSNTSGSSGQPFFFAKNKDAHSMDWALIKDRYRWHNLELNSKQARFYGIPLDFIGYHKEKIKDFIMNRVRFPVFDLSEKKLNKFYKRFKIHKFDYIYGYTNSLIIFAEYLVKKKIILKKVCPTLKCCIVTSEMLFEKDKELLHEAFGIDILNEYGASEVGLIGFSSPNADFVISDEILFCEVLKDNKLDNAGDLLITDFDNKVMPFIRYEVGDLVSINKESFYKSFNRIINKLHGRKNDTIVLPSGKVSPGLTLYYVTRSLFESKTTIKEYIVRQTKINEFVLDIVSDRPLSNSFKSEVRLKMEKYLEPNLKIIFNRVEKIIRPQSGKIKHFFSEIN